VILSLEQISSLNYYVLNIANNTDERLPYTEVSAIIATYYDFNNDFETMGVKTILDTDNNEIIVNDETKEFIINLFNKERRSL
jgi:hypothetical protein